MATARDVATRAGVSISTVSHVVNGTRRVSPELRERVLAATRELGFEPNAVARSLKIKRSHTIGLVISDIGNPFFTSVVRGVEDIAQARGYTLILGNSDEDPAKEAEYLRILFSRRIDGLILAPAGDAHPYLVGLVKGGFPLVFLDREVPDLSVPAVLLQSEEAAFEGVRHLIGLGHRRIAMITGRPRISSTTDRLAGYRRALESEGLPLDDDLVATGGSRAEGARVAARELLDRIPPPTAFFVGNNLMTIGAVAAIKERGLSIPDDIAVVGFDDFMWASLFRPTLTTVAQPTYDLGRTAAELLIHRIEGDLDTVPNRVLLPGTLVIRESSGAHLGPTDGTLPTPLTTEGAA